jgi:hypothetical protein
MSYWLTITPDHLKAAGHSAIVDRAQTLAVGSLDPVADAISSAVARVRRAVEAANDLDTDATKVPKSLEDVTVRLALFRLMERIGLPLSEDQRKSRDLDAADLKELTQRRIRIEPPDNPDTTVTPQNRGNWNSESKLIMRTHPVPPPTTQFPPASDYANPEAPADAP